MIKDLDFNQCQAQIRSELQQLFMQLPENDLTRAMHHTFIPGSKLLRPMLVYSTAHAFDTSLNDRLLSHACMAVECIHVYSLIHDDLPAMDNDDIRRGQASCHRAFHESTAILAGDALLTMAFECLSDPHLGQPELQCQLINILAKASGHQGMALGQVMDLAHMQASTSIDTLAEIYHLKTSCLIAAAVQMGALIALKDTALIPPSLLKFGNSFGLAFQIHDDLLDIEEETAVMGKPKHSDADRNKPTYPSILGPEQTRESLDTLTQQSLSYLSQSGLHQQALLAHIVSIAIPTNNE